MISCAFAVTQAHTEIAGRGCLCTGQTGICLAHGDPIGQAESDLPCAQDTGSVGKFELVSGPRVAGPWAGQGTATQIRKIK